MTVRLPVHAELKDDKIELKAVNKADWESVKRQYQKKGEWEKRNKREFYYHATLELRYQKITEKQVNSVFLLVATIFESVEGRKPDEDEKQAYYNDLLELYAPRVPTFFGGTRPVRVSEANSMEGAIFIEGLIYHLAEFCDLSCDAQVTVVEIMELWHEQRGEMETDPTDYADFECTEMLAEAAWREKHIVSDATGRGGAIVLHHIVTRGSNKAAENKAWNWLALTEDEHRMLHAQGNDNFLSIYPHLRGRFTKAKKLADQIQGHKEIRKQEAMEALNE